MTSQAVSPPLFDFSNVVRMQTEVLAAFTNSVQDAMRNSMHVFCELHAPIVKAQSNAVDEWSKAWTRAAHGIKAKQHRELRAEATQAPLST